MALKSQRVRVVPATSLTPAEWLTLRQPTTRSHHHRGTPEYDPRSILAIRGRYVVGYWLFDVSRDAGVTQINSTFTYVTPTLRRTGLARRLWDVGVAAWCPDVIHAAVGSNAGYRFLCHAIVRYGRRGVVVEVDCHDAAVHPYERALRTLLAAQAAVRPRRRRRVAASRVSRATATSKTMH